MLPSQLDFLRHIEHECDFILRSCKGKSEEEITNDEVLRRAVVRSIEIIGEAVKRLDDDFRSAHPEVEWKKIAGTRDMMIHHYFGIDYEIVWEIITDKIPPLHEFLQQIIEREGS